MVFNSEVALVNQAKKNRDAFAVLYDRYFNRVYSFVASRVNSQDTAEDLSSEIWLKILDNLGKFTPKKDYHVPAWIFRIARNHLIDHYRTRKSTISEETLEYLSGNTPSIDNEIDVGLEIKRIRAIMDNLPPAESEVVSMKYLSELRNKEIAAILEIKERTVSSHLSRGLRRIRKQISDIT